MENTKTSPCFWEKHPGEKEQFITDPGTRLAEFGKILAQGVRGGECRCGLYPQYSDRAGWKQAFQGELRSRVAQGILAHADELIRRGVPELPAASYFAFRRYQNRTDLESVYFQRRTNLGTLVLAACLSGDFAKYGDSIVNYLCAVTSERYWCIHAHAWYGDSGDVSPDDAITRRRVDLFSAGTASLFGLTLYLLENELKAFSPRLFNILKQETLDRVIFPFLDDSMDQYHSWLTRHHNWVPWNCDNLLLAGLHLLQDEPEMLAKLVQKSSRLCGNFMANYPENGFCNEGPDYWCKAACSLAYWLWRLEKALPGSAEPYFANLKFQNMMAFPLYVMTAPGYLMSFADGGRCFESAPGLLSIMARETGARNVRSLAGIAFRNMKAKMAAPDYRFQKECGELLREALILLFDMPADLHEETVPALPEEDFMEGHVVNLRTANGFSASLKGGNNAEAHNHNDLGHFSLFFRGQPLVIDLGSEVYSARTFSSERYTLLCQNALGHNAPVFGNTMQQHGAEYVCSLEKTGKNRFRADLSRAYPAGSGIAFLSRELTLAENFCCIEDRCEGTPELPVTLMLFSPAELCKEGNTVRFAPGVVLTMEGMDEISVEPFCTEDPHLRHSWGDHITRITLRTAQKAWKLHFTV